MTAALYAVAAIGNAIVDIIGMCDEDFLARHGAAKGSMRLVDAETVQKLYSEMGPAIEISGGSAANTMVGLASFGGKAAFIGKVAGDEFGRIFRHDIGAAGVAFETAAVNGKAPTSRSLILVTPDGERTMNTFLGISTDLDHGEVDAATVEGAQIVYLEGYLFDQPQAKSAFRQAVTIAGKAGRTVALTLSDGFCVERHRDEFLDLIRGGVGILFANERPISKKQPAGPPTIRDLPFLPAAPKAPSSLPRAPLTKFRSIPSRRSSTQRERATFMLRVFYTA
jgi:sugar/nucleoside kinase (ribokinase family)